MQKYEPLKLQNIFLLQKRKILFTTVGFKPMAGTLAAELQPLPFKSVLSRVISQSIWDRAFLGNYSARQTNIF